MTYFNMATPYRAEERRRPASKGQDEAWYMAMVYGFFALLYAKDILSPKRFRKAMFPVQRQHSYFIDDFYVKGCKHLRADLRKKQGKILGDIDWYNTETHEPQGLRGLKPKAAIAGHLMAVLLSCVSTPLTSGPIRASPQ